MGRLDRELRPESESVPEWLLARQLSEPGLSAPAAPSRWVRLTWLSESAGAAGRTPKLAGPGAVLILGITGLKAMGRIRVFSTFWGGKEGRARLRELAASSGWPHTTGGLGNPRILSPCNTWRCPQPQNFHVLKGTSTKRSLPPDGVGKAPTFTVPPLA